MKKGIQILIYLFSIGFIAIACSKQARPSGPAPPKNDTGLVNTTHLDALYTPVVFPDGVHASGIYIYSQYPDYHPVEASGEGFTCVDDVSRAALFYLRNNNFSTDTAAQSKVSNLIRFILEMQSPNGYFYNFLQTDGSINTGGSTSAATPNWWSWRALQALTEAAPAVGRINPQLGGQMNDAINKLIANIKTDFVNLPLTTQVISGITVPQWLPQGSGTDQAATLVLGLISYCTTTNDTTMSAYIRKLATGIAMMQQGDASHFPYSFFLSWENQWHAYGSDQSFALLQTGIFLQDTSFTNKALAEVSNYYPWLLANGFEASITVTDSNNQIQPLSQSSYDQIAYGFRPMIFAAIEAYSITGEDKYADIAGHLAAWFLGANLANTNMYDVSTGRCFDAISAGNQVNLNSGGESTIEALLALQRLENFPAVLTALNKYRKP